MSPAVASCILPDTSGGVLSVPSLRAALGRAALAVRSRLLHSVPLGWACRASVGTVAAVSLAALVLLLSALRRCLWGLVTSSRRRVSAVRLRASVLGRFQPFCALFFLPWLVLRWWASMPFLWLLASSVGRSVGGALLRDIFRLSAGA